MLSTALLPFRLAAGRFGCCSFPAKFCAAPLLQRNEDKADHDQSPHRVYPGWQAKAPQFSLDELTGDKIGFVYAHRRLVGRIEVDPELGLAGARAKRQILTEI